MSTLVDAAGNAASTNVLTCADIDPVKIDALLARYGVSARRVDQGQPIPGSYWGESEAGLIGQQIHYRGDTPAHSLLHELGHFICMTATRRQGLDTDAGGTDAEECAVCFLELVLAQHLPPFSTRRCLQDMDAWGYSFREGSATAWFDGDGLEAFEWLLRHELVDADRHPTWRLRG